MPISIRLFIASLFIALVPACSTYPLPASSATTEEPAQVIPPEALNPDVRQETIQQTICVPGYTASVRPSTTYTNGVKVKLLRETGRPPAAASDFELDHRVPLALGGHPRSLKNLELQPWEGEDGAKKKDRLERRLQRLVCAGSEPLAHAQRAIYEDWKDAYRKYVDGLR
jgi:hypothetical protein